MTRSELIQAIAERFPQLKKTDCDVAVKEIMDAISQALARRWPRGNPWFRYL